MTATHPYLSGIWTDDFAVRSAYSEGAGPYRIVPAAVAVPKDTGDLSKLVMFVKEAGSSIVPRGAGSAIPGGNVGHGVVVDMREFSDPPTFTGPRTIRAGSACRWIQVDEVAATRGLRLPPDPASKEFCTVGGNVSTNAAGPRTLRYGAMRDWVEGVEFMTADGELEWISRSGHTPASRATREFTSEVAPRIEKARDLIGAAFPKTTKNSAGYALDAYLRSGDLLDLIIGSEGTLGFVTQVEFRLDPVPAEKSTILVTLADLTGLSEIIGRLRDVRPAALELLDRTFLDVTGGHSVVDVGDAAAVLLVDIEGGSPNEVAATLARAAHSVAGLASGVMTAASPDEVAKLWSIRRGASHTLTRLPDPMRSLQIIEDGCVPVAALSEYLTGVKAAAARTDIPVVAFGHAGDGHLHVNALVDTSAADLASRLRGLLDQVTDLLCRLGGTTGGEHGDGRLRASALKQFYGTEVVGLFEQVKAVFDPEGIMNPGVVLPESEDPIHDLKVGSGAAPIPTHIASALRRMERDATWGTSFEVAGL